MNFKFCFALTGAKLLLLYFLRIFFVFAFYNDFKVRTTVLQIQNKLFDNLIITNCTFILNLLTQISRFPV